MLLSTSDFPLAPCRTYPSGPRTKTILPLRLRAVVGRIFLAAPGSLPGGRVLSNACHLMSVISHDPLTFYYDALQPHETLQPFHSVMVDSLVDLVVSTFCL